MTENRKLREAVVELTTVGVVVMLATTAAQAAVTDPRAALTPEELGQVQNIVQQQFISDSLKLPDGLSADAQKAFTTKNRMRFIYTAGRCYGCAY